MSRIVEAVVSSVVVLIGNIVLTLLLTELSEDRGWYTAGAPVDTENGSLQFLDIYNLSTSALNTLIVSVSASTDVTAIRSSSSITIDMRPKPRNDNILLSISSVPPARLTRILMPVQDDRGSRAPEIINAADIGLSHIDPNGLPTSRIEEVQESFLNAAMYAMLFGIFVYFLNTNTDRHMMLMKNELKKAKRDAVDIRVNLDNVRKYHLLYLARLRDLTKELDFWRDTIRKTMVGAGHVLEDGDKLIHTVTRNLKTYSTLRESDFEHVRVLAELLKDAEKT